MNRPLAAALVALASTGARIAASQTEASLGIGVGTVRFPGGTSFSTAAFSPALQLTSPGGAFASFAGAFASLPQGEWSVQGRADAWAATPALASRWRLGVEGIAAGTTRTDGGGTGALHGVGEVLWSAPRWGIGVGAGPSAGWIANEPSVTALHTRARAWWKSGAADWGASVEPTRFLGAWFTDVNAGVTLDRSTVVLSLWAAARLSRAYGSKAAASAFVQVYLSPSVALEAGGGSYLPDPYQGLPRAGYATAGLRLRAPPRAGRGARPRSPPLTPALRGDSLVVRFRLEGAQTVAIAGDWSAWRPVPLDPIGDGTWEGTLALSPGLYHFNLLVDGAEWVVPNGVATVADGLGGLVGVLLIR